MSKVRVWVVVSGFKNWRDKGGFPSVKVFYEHSKALEYYSSLLTEVYRDKLERLSGESDDLFAVRIQEEYDDALSSGHHGWLLCEGARIPHIHKVSVD